MAPPTSHSATHLPTSALSNLSSFANSVQSTIASLGHDLAAAQKLITTLQGEVKHLQDSRLSQQLQIDALTSEHHRVKERLAQAPQPEPAERGEGAVRRKSVGGLEGGVRLPEVRNGVGKPGPEGKRELLTKRKPPDIFVTADSDQDSSDQDAGPAAKAPAPPPRKRRATTGQKRDKGPGQASAW